MVDLFRRHGPCTLLHLRQLGRENIEAGLAKVGCCTEGVDIGSNSVVTYTWNSAWIHAVLGKTAVNAEAHY